MTRSALQTTTARLLLRRAAVRAGLLSGIVLAIALAVGLVCGLSALVSVETRAAVASAVPGADDDAGRLDLTTRLSTDPGAQDAAASELFARELGARAVVQRVEDAAGSDTARVTWRITPAPDLAPEEFVRLRDAVHTLPADFRSSPAAVQGSTDSGGLAASLDAATAGVSTTIAASAAPAILAALLGWFALRELGRLLGMVRGAETTTLGARGMTRRQMVPIAAVESATVTLVGGALGAAAAAAGLFAWRPSPDTLAAVAASLGWGALMALAVGATLVVVSVRAATRAGGRNVAAGRVARVTTGGAAVLVVLAAGALLWQLSSAGQLSSDDAWRGIVTALAPVAAVAASAVVTVVVFAPVAALIARGVSRRRDASLTLPARQVARRASTFAVVVAVIALAVTTATLAAGYAGTWRAASADAADAAAGAALRATAGPSGATPAEAAAAAAVPGIRAAAAATRIAVSASDVDADLLALPAAQAADVLLDVPGAAAPAEIGAALSTGATGAALPADARRLRLEAQIDAPAGTPADPVAFRAVLQDAGGTPSAVDFVAAGGGAYDAALAEGVGPWRLLSITAALREAPAGSSAGLRSIRLSTDAGALTGVTIPERVAVGCPAGRSPCQPAATRTTVWVAGGVGDPQEAPAVPAVVTADVARALNLGVGDEVDLQVRGSGASYRLAVASIADVLPGVARGAIVDLGALAPQLDLTRGGSGDASSAAATEIWAAGDPSAAPALAAATGTSVLVPIDPAAAVAGVLVDVWRAAAVGGALLAIIGILALAQSLLQSWRGEVALLRAVGMSTRMQARLRARELLGSGVLAALLAAPFAVAVTVQLAPALASLVVSAARTPRFDLDPWPLATGGVLVLAALAACVVATRRVLGSPGATPSSPGETE